MTNIKTSYRTFCKQVKKLIIKNIPTAKTFKMNVICYQKMYRILDNNKNTIAYCSKIDGYMAINIF